MISLGTLHMRGMCARQLEDSRRAKKHQVSFCGRREWGGYAIMVMERGGTFGSQC